MHVLVPNSTINFQMTWLCPPHRVHLHLRHSHFGCPRASNKDRAAFLSSLRLDQAGPCEPWVSPGAEGQNALLYLPRLPIGLRLRADD